MRPPRDVMKAGTRTADPQRLAALESTLRDSSFPPQVIIEITNGCNLRCPMCDHGTMTRVPAIMDDALYDKIVEEIGREAPQTRVWMSFYGEALLTKDRLWSFLRRGRQAGLRDITLNTNGTLLNDARIERLLHDGPDRIIFSIDGLLPETFERCRAGARHAEVYANVAKVIRGAQANGGRPEVVVQIIDMPDTHPEIPAFVEYWTGLGATVKVKELLGWTGAAVELPAGADHRIPCPWVMTTFPITVIGEAVLCGVDYDAKVPIGNVRNQTIRELWATHRQYRRIHMQRRWDDLPDLCMGCTDWCVVGARTYEPIGTQKR